MGAANVRIPNVDDQAAADLFAYFYSTRFLKSLPTLRAASVCFPIAAARDATASRRNSSPEFRR